MKTYIILMGLVMFLSSCVADTQLSTSTSKASEDEFEEVVKTLDSPQSISHYMLNRIHYTKGVQYDSSRIHGYHWKYPEETFKDGYGFCYDLSAFALYALRRHGNSSARLLFVCWGNWGIVSESGHFVTVYEEGNQYYSIDSGVLKGPFGTLDGLLKSASRNRKIRNHRFFNYDEIRFHTTYTDMRFFCP